MRGRRKSSRLEGTRTGSHSLAAPHEGSATGSIGAGRLLGEDHPFCRSGVREGKVDVQQLVICKVLGNSVLSVPVLKNLHVA